MPFKGQVVHGTARGRGQCPTRAAARLRNVMQRTGGAGTWAWAWAVSHTRCRALAQRHAEDR